MSERQIQAEVLLALGARPDLGRFWRQNTGSARAFDDPGRVITFGVPGAADISGILRGSGRRVEIEIKTATGRQSLQQQRFEAMIRAMGGIYVVARCQDDAVLALEQAQQGASA